MEWIIILVGILLVVTGILYFMFSYKKDTNSTVDRAQQLSQNKYDPNMTRFAAAKEAKAAAVRGELLTNVNFEIGQLTATIDKEAAALKAGYRKSDTFSEYSLEREKSLADHESYLALAENKAAVARIASEKGLDPETMRQLILEEAKFKKELILEEARLNKEILLEELKFKNLLAAKTHEMELDVTKIGRIKAIEFDFEKKAAMLDKDMAEIQHLLPEYLYTALHKQLSDVNMEFEMAKEIDEGEYKDRELKRIGTRMKALEKRIRDQQKNL